LPEEEYDFQFFRLRCFFFVFVFFPVIFILQRSKLRPFWSPWRVEKIFGDKPLAKIANWRPTGYKRNLLEKLSIIGQN